LSRPDDQSSSKAVFDADDRPATLFLQQFNHTCGVERSLAQAIKPASEKVRGRHIDSQRHVTPRLVPRRSNRFDCVIQHRIDIRERRCESPFVRFERARRSGKLWVTEAMFPGYVFTRFRYLSQSRQVRATRGVVKIVSFGDVPARVPSEIISELRSAVQDRETIVIQPGIEVGEEVR
jgi:transcription antitermination factor NusG